MYCVSHYVSITMTTTITATPPVTVVCCREPITMSYSGTHLCVQNNIGSVWFGFCHHSWFKGNNEGFHWPHNYATATKTVPDPFSGICQLCHGSLVGVFSLSKLSIPPIHFICSCLWGCCFGFQVHMWVYCLPIGVQSLGCASQSFRVYPWQAYIPPGDGLWPHQECSEWLLLPMLWERGDSCYLLSCLQAIPSIWWGIQPWGISRESPNPSAFPIQWVRGLHVQVVSHLMTQLTPKSVVHI